MPLFLIHLFYTTVLKFDIVFLVEVNFFLKLHWKKIDLLFIQITIYYIININLNYEEKGDLWSELLKWQQRSQGDSYNSNLTLFYEQEKYR